MPTRPRDNGAAAPRVSPPDVPADLEQASLAPRCDISAARVVTSGQTHAAHARLVEVVLDAAGVIDLTGATLIDVEIAAADLVELTARHGRWRSVRLSGGRIGALDLSATELDSVELRDVRIEYLNLAGTVARDMLIAGCRIRSIDLPDARLERVRFEESDTDEVVTSRLRASHLDLRGLRTLGITDPAALAGAWISPEQAELLAVDLASALGIRVQD